MADEEEDDYMSDAILNQCQETRPGLIPKHVKRVIQKTEKEKKANLQNITKPRKVQEAEKRDEGMKAAIGSENKGFALLSKMGYKPGMAIGKRGEGRTEPVGIELKAGRSGLGRETEMKRRKERSDALKVMSAQKKQKIEIKQKQHFQKRMSSKYTEQQAERDVLKSQRACEQLDAQKGIEEPVLSYFWPASRLPKRKIVQSTDDYDDDFNDDRDDHIPRKPRLDREEYEEEEEEEEEYEEEDSLPSQEKLLYLTEYLRKTHLYCIWCGTSYNDTDDIKTNCPGDNAEAHEEW